MSWKLLIDSLSSSITLDSRLTLETTLTSVEDTVLKIRYSVSSIKISQI